MEESLAVTSARLLAYLDLERAMLGLDDLDDPLADNLRDAMDPLWFGLSDEERAMLDRGDLQRPALRGASLANETRVQVAGPDEISMVDRHLFCAVNQIPALPLMGYGQHWFIVQRQLESGDWDDVTPTAGLWIPSPTMLGASQPA